MCRATAYLHTMHSTSSTVVLLYSMQSIYHWSEEGKNLAKMPIYNHNAIIATTSHNDEASPSFDLEVKLFT